MRHSDNRVLAVWGSPSCGKTTIAAKVANYIAGKGFDVALLLCDTDAPPLPLLVPPWQKSLEYLQRILIGMEHSIMKQVIRTCIWLYIRQEVSMDLSQKKR